MSLTSNDFTISSLGDVSQLAGWIGRARCFWQTDKAASLETAPREETNPDQGEFLEEKSYLRKMGIMSANGLGNDKACVCLSEGRWRSEAVSLRLLRGLRDDIKIYLLLCGLGLGSVVSTYKSLQLPHPF